MMTQVLSTNASIVCECEMEGFPCNKETLPYCISQFQNQLGQNYIKTECVEKIQNVPICVRFYKSETPCP